MYKYLPELLAEIIPHIRLIAHEEAVPHLSLECQWMGHETAFEPFFEPIPAPLYRVEFGGGSGDVPNLAGPTVHTLD